MQQLETSKGQLEQEMEILSSSISQLKELQTKYEDAKECLNEVNKSNESKEVLVPLSSSLYVPGKLCDSDHVLIDVGTGYYAEMSVDDAKDFFRRKIEHFTNEMEKLQAALNEKTAMKQAVLEMLNKLMI